MPSRAKLHADLELSRDPEDVFHRFKVKLIAQNHVFGKKQSLGGSSVAAGKDKRNAAERELDKLNKLGEQVGSKHSEKRGEMQWFHRHPGDTTLKLVQRVQTDLRHYLAGSEKSPLLVQLLRLDDPFAELTENQGHLSDSAKVLSSKIRDEEMMSMLYEDVRGDLANEPGFRTVSSSLAQATTQGADTGSGVLPPAIIPLHLQEYQAKAKSEQDAADARRRREENAETALDYLRDPRPLTLADRRNEAVFMVRIIKLTGGGGVGGNKTTLGASASATAGANYVLHWSKPTDDIEEQTLWQGSITLADIKGVSDGPIEDRRGSCIINVDQQNSRAMKTNGGRTKIVFKGDAVEISKFRQRLSALLEAL
jgi:hypothetical protein